ncbi:MAG: DNA polymerase III subunit delta' [Xanthomonadales bacterium]
MTMAWLDPVREEFRKRLQGDRLAHAFLLSGQTGTGKQGLAMEMAAALLCLENSLPACGSCRSCQLLVSGAHPDFRILSFELNKNGKLRTEIVIDQIRELISFLQLTTTISEKKAALVHPAEVMNRHAANALLKTLEEPPGDAVIILLSHDPSRLAVTLTSRCQKLQVRSPDTDTALAWLLESGVYREAEARSALQAAAGSPLRARAMLSEDGPDHYRLVNDTLESMLDGHCAPASANSALGDVEPNRLWTWLSLSAADRLRQNRDSHTVTLSLVQLQSMADRNRALLSSPVRKDLLLQDWLIQWARLET